MACAYKCAYKCAFFLRVWMKLVHFYYTCTWKFEYKCAFFFIVCGAPFLKKIYKKNDEDEWIMCQCWHTLLMVDTRISVLAIDNFDYLKMPICQHSPGSQQGENGRIKLLPRQCRHWFIANGKSMASLELCANQYS